MNIPISRCGALVADRMEEQAALSQALLASQALRLAGGASEEEQLMWAMSQLDPAEVMRTSHAEVSSSSQRARGTCGSGNGRSVGRRTTGNEQSASNLLVARTPSTAAAMDSEIGSYSDTIRPGLSNPARQRRQQCRQQQQQQQQRGQEHQHQQHHQHHQHHQRRPPDEPSEGNAAHIPTSMDAVRPCPRLGPPNASLNSVPDHPSWRLAELPPPAQWAPKSASSGPPIVVWLRQEMRLADNPALHAAAATRRPVIPVFVLAPDAEEGGWPLSGAAKLWQHHALSTLSHSLRALGSALVLRDARRATYAISDEPSPASGGQTLSMILSLVRETGANSVYWCRRYEPWHAARDEAIAEALRSCGADVRAFVCSVLYEPWQVRPAERSSNMGFGSVGFWMNACSSCTEPPPPLPKPDRLEPPARWPESRRLSELGLLVWPRRPDGSVIDWGCGIRRFWTAGEAGAHEALEEFLRDGVGRFEGRRRHRADERNTSLISPYLRFGELSPRQVWYGALSGLDENRSPPATYLRKLAWRDLAYWALWRFPTLANQPFRAHYSAQPWESDPGGKLLDAWQRGTTGYPLVDAAMHQLWEVGWLPNYMRHVVASFLVEFLNLDWRLGERWFAETLVDADTAINAFMWQNGGHSGMDQWNFVMHPVYAAKSCDPEGDYVREWLPQLAKLPVEYIHCPWEAPAAVRASAKVVMGSGTRATYPQRVLTDLEAARRRSHEAVMVVRKGVGKQNILPSGHEVVELDNGQRAVLITRSDYREGKITTRQTAEAKWDVRRRDRTDNLSLAMRDSQRLHSAGRSLMQNSDEADI